jgi:hypothetical protein
MADLVVEPLRARHPTLLPGDQVAAPLIQVPAAASAALAAASVRHGDHLSRSGG